MTVSAHGLFFEQQFVPLLKAAWHASGHVPRSGRVVAGREVFDKLVLPSEDGPHTIIGGVGWVELALDEAMDPWHARIAERERDADPA